MVKIGLVLVIFLRGKPFCCFYQLYILYSLLASVHKWCTHLLGANESRISSPLPSPTLDTTGFIYLLYYTIRKIKVRILNLLQLRQFWELRAKIGIKMLLSIPATSYQICLYSFNLNCYELKPTYIRIKLDYNVKNG